MVDIDDLDDDVKFYDNEKNGEQVYDPAELAPGGRGKQGDQQQMGQGREARRDKSRDEGGSDKLHEH